jgi:hypothetical protein
MELTERLRAALDTEEARLHALPPFPWKLNPDDDTEVYAADDVVVAEAWALSTQQQKRVAQHILAGSPEVGLRRIAVDRKILALHDPLANLDATSPHARERFTKGYYCPTCGGRDWDIEEIGDEPCDTVKALAEAYGIEA